MSDQIPGFLKSLYVLGCLAVFIVLLAAFVARSRRSGLTRTWTPLLQVVHGTVTSRHLTSTLSGEYHGYPVLATISRGGQDTPDVFSVEIPAGPGGRDWGIAHRSEKMLGPETWRPFTKDPALQTRLTSAGAAAHFQAWPKHAQVQYDAARGKLAMREEILAPTPEHFREQLNMLEWLAEVNADVNN
jgi:hypothetical protein